MNYIKQIDANMHFSGTLNKTASWVIVHIATGQPVMETFNSSIIQKINKDKYNVVPILEYLQSLNRKKDPS